MEPAQGSLNTKTGGGWWRGKLPDTRMYRWTDGRTDVPADRRTHTSRRRFFSAGVHTGGFDRELFKGLFLGWWAAFKTFQTGGGSGGGEGG